MKDSVRILSRTMRVAIAAAMIATAACAKSNKPADVAQDSILVKDADVAGNKTDTAGAATAALVRERGSGAQLPALTNGAPVTRSSDGGPAVPPTSATRTTRASTAQPTLQPPKKVYPSPVLPPRESTVTTPRGSVISTPTSPPPVSQPVSPQPPPVSQPIPPAPKKDSSADSLSAC
jgi:hypothetical protein